MYPTSYLVGTTLQPGFRPDASHVPGGHGRAFGTPNVRSDKPKPARRSIADNQVTTSTK